MNQLSVPSANNNELTYNDQFRYPNIHTNQPPVSNFEKENPNLLNIKPNLYPYSKAYQNFNNPVHYTMNSINPYNWPTQKVLNDQAQTPITIIIQPQNTGLPPIPAPANPPPASSSVTPPPAATPSPQSSNVHTPSPQATNTDDKTIVETIIRTTVSTTTHSASSTGTNSGSNTKSTSNHTSSQTSNSQKAKFKLPMRVAIFILLQLII